MTPQGLALLSLFCIALTIAVIYDHNKAKKKGAELEEKFLHVVCENADWIQWS